MHAWENLVVGSRAAGPAGPVGRHNDVGIGGHHSVGTHRHHATYEPTHGAHLPRQPDLRVSRPFR